VTRRTTTLLVTVILLIAMVAIGFALPVPFVALQPGPTGDTLGKVDGTQLITINGDVKTYPADGKLLLTTVSEQPTLTLFSVVGYWLSSHDAVVPEELINPQGSSQEEQQKQNQADMVTSQENATTAALHFLKIPAKVTVTSTTKGLPADGVLQRGDVITDINGTAILDSVALRAAISPLKPGTDIKVTYQRGGATRVVTLKTAANPDDETLSAIGVVPNDVRDFTVKIALKGVGGPSAGLMFALGIIDRLEPAQLTDGKTIAGTGEIGLDGTVSPIGGIQQKLVGARKAGATVFLVPADNCNEAKKAIPGGLRLVKVENLSQAVTALQDLRSGQGNPAGC
jgi:Lon-like protease